MLRVRVPPPRRPWKRDVFETAYLGVFLAFLLLGWADVLLGVVGDSDAGYVALWTLPTAFGLWGWWTFYRLLQQRAATAARNARRRWTFTARPGRPPARRTRDAAMTTAAGLPVRTG